MVHYIVIIVLCSRKHEKQLKYIKGEINMIQNNKIKDLNQVKMSDIVKTMKYFSIKPRIQKRNKRGKY